MATIVTYNGITLHSVITTRFQQTPHYDASGTDVVFSKFSFTFEGLCHAQGTHSGVPVWVGSGSGTNLSTQKALVDISQALWQPRKTLTVIMGGDSMFQCDGSVEASGSNPSFMDLDNGPKPKNVTLTHITSNSSVGPTFHVTFEIECARSMCPGGTIQPLLSNRWSISESLDEEYFTQRTIAGQIKLSQINASWDGWRAMIVPTLEDGFKRDRIDFNVQPNGLTIDYVVTDKQVHTAAPWPAATISVRHSEGTGDGAKFESECHVTLKGHPGANKLALFSLAAKIIEDRMGKIKDIGKKGSSIVPVQFTMVDVTGERNEIEVFLKLQHALLDTGTGTLSNPENYLGTPMGAIGRPLGKIYDIWLGNMGEAGDYPKEYDPKKSLAPGVWGYNSGAGEEARKSGITRLLMYCYLQWPCDDKHRIAIKQEAPSTATNPPTTGTPPDDTKVYDSPGTTHYVEGQLDSKAVAPTSTGGIFTHAAAETTLHITPGRVQLPIAASSAAYQQGSDTSVFVDIGLTQASMTFHIECEKTGSWPSIPEPVGTWTYGTLKGYLKDSKIVPMPPTVDATATKAIYHVSCKLTYGLSRPPTRDEKVPIGVLPFTNFKQSDTSLLLSDLYKDPNQQQLFGPKSPGNAGASSSY